MASEDQFTSIQWDRDDVASTEAPASPPPPQYAVIHEGDEHRESKELSGGDESSHGDAELESEDPSNSLLMSPERDHSSTGGDDIGHNSSSASVNSLSSAGRADSYKQIAPDFGTHHDEHEEAHHGEEEVLFNMVSTVTEPMRDIDSQSKPYISYLLTTVTNNTSIAKLSRQVIEPEKNIVVKIRRRYGDFKFLYDCLCNDYPQLLVPPLPSKSNFKYLTGDTFSTEFVNKRLNSLNRFIKYLCQHNSFARSKIFHLFLSDSTDWSTFQKNLKISKNSLGGGSVSNDSEIDSSFTSNVVNKVVNEDLLTETIMNFLTPSKHKRESNKEIIEISDKLKKLYENLIKLDRIFSKLNKKNYDLSFDYEQFSNQITKLSNVNNTTESNGNTTGSHDAQVTNNFKTFADSLSYFSENWSNLHKYIDESFLVSLKDCAKYIISLTNLIHLQHNKKIDLQVLQDYLNKARGELAGLTGHTHNGQTSAPNPVISGTHTGGLVNNTTQLIKDTLSTSSTNHIGSSHTDNKKLKLQARIEQLEAEIKLQTQLVHDLTNRIINEEYPNWDRFNKIELKTTMLGLCDQQINFYSGLVSKWSDAESKLLNRLQELS
ncbi:sorting nexin-4 [[Candida] anglica]